MTPDQIKDRAFRAASAMSDFVGPACEAARAEYMSALTHIAANEPWETAKITKLSVALKVISMVEQHLKADIMNGRAATAETDRAAQIAKLPEAKRRWLGGTN